jgi:hypothetical protein
MVDFSDCNIINNFLRFATSRISRNRQSGKKDFEVVAYKEPDGETGWLELFTFPLINSKTGDPFIKRNISGSYKQVT